MSIRKTMTMVTAATLAAVFLQASPGQAAYVPGKAQTEKPVIGFSVTPGAGQAIAPTGKAFRPKAPVWPGQSSVELAMPSRAARAAGNGEPAWASGLPVGVIADASRVKVESFGRAATAKAGVNGMLVRVGRADGVGASSAGRVTIDYNAFRWANGGDWASRLRLWVLPECALTTPALPRCQGKELPTSNDLTKGLASAPINVDGTVNRSGGSRGGLQSGVDSGQSVTTGTLVALAAAASGGGGDYKATSLAPSATWNAGSNTGDFSWNYPLRVPPATGGPAPEIALSYSSSSVDGRMASTNSQPSMIGEGFDWHPGYIERRYTACADDMANGASNTVKSGDQCWVTDNATVSLSGHAGELLKDPSVANRWRLKNDDGSYIERRTGGTNGDNDGEYWVLTTTGGTQYWFGGRAGSNSTLTVPVYGNHSGEPCNLTSGFAASFCAQAYRWQLDYVVDTHQNIMSYTYAKETNKYGKNNSASDLATYDRAGYVKKIEYGTRVGLAGNAPMVVEFGEADRCLTNCGVATSWPDVPSDQECLGSTCNMHAPSFWTRKRLSTITTRVWDAGGSAYREVESWTLTHGFPDPEDQITAALWLERISHRGTGGTSMPDVTFAGTYRPNRVDTQNDSYPAMNKYRIMTVNSESGGKLTITYSGNDCVKGSRMPDVNALQDNKLRCYPVKWTPSGQPAPITDFFHKHVVSKVTEADVSGASRQMVTQYDYLEDPAWHYTDDDGLIKAENKTYSVWRGYGKVRTTKGEGTEQTVEERRYFRGMFGDRLPSGTRQNKVDTIEDHDTFAGTVRETIVYDGTAVVSSSLTEPYRSDPTATRTINGTTVYARQSGTKETRQSTTLDGGRGVRTTSQTTKYDSYGMPIESEDQGQAGSGDEKCTLIDYVRNADPAVWIVDRKSRQRVFAVDCATAKAGNLTNDDIIDDTKSYYDQLAWNQAPTDGDLSKTERFGVVQGSAKFDDHGRTVESTDIRGGISYTAFTPAVGGPMTAMVETNPKGWTKKTSFDPAWGSPKETEDANQRKIHFAYDGLGRLTAVWTPGRDPATPANFVFEYLVRNNGATVVTTKRLNAAGGYITSYKFYDNLLRERQTQDLDGAVGGTAAVITDTYYDSVGRVYKTHEPYLAADTNLNPVVPSANLFNPTGNIPRFTMNKFDKAGRTTAVINKVDGAPASDTGGTVLSQTTTVYGGDRTDVIPPAGGTVVSTLTDAGGQTVEMRQYHPGVTPAHNTPAADYDSTRYAYNRKGQMVSVTDQLGTKWSYEYDMLGRRTKEIDPDKGATTVRYNVAGDVSSTTDGRGVTIAHKYDLIGRKLSTHDGSETGPMRSQWEYDLLANGWPAKGQLVRTTRYVGTDKYIKEHLGYTTDYQPTSVKYTIPQADLNGEYTYNYTYNQDGSTATMRLPALGDLGLEQLTYKYDGLARRTEMRTNLGSTYVTGTEYTSFGEPGVIHLRNNTGDLVDLVRTYELGNRRLDRIWTTRQTAPTTVVDMRYSYDDMGNITKLSDVAGGDYQCFATDYLRRMTSAKASAAADCSGTPTYQQSFEFDVLGNRNKMISDGVTTTYNTTGHKLMSTSAGGNYTYDNAGNMLTRPTPSAGTQQMTWDAEGHLATSKDSTGDTSYIYDVDGSRLIRIDPTGKTLFLPGQEVRFNKATGTKKCTRYYGHAGMQVAMRTGAGLVWLSGDHHGTVGASINAVGQTVSIRKQKPFGEDRGITGTWPSAMDKGLVGGTKDNTGLTHLGAREFDPLIGRFISVDPVIDHLDSQQLHGYAYANNSPISAHDADGQWPKWNSVVNFAVKAATNPIGTAVSAAKAVGSAVAKGATAVGKWVYNNAGWISTVAGVAAMACTVIPPLQVFAPGLAIVAAVAGAIDTAKSCSEGAALDCAVGVAGMIPGVRTLTSVKKGYDASKRALMLNKAVGSADKLAEYSGDLSKGGDALWAVQQMRMQAMAGDLRGMRGDWDFQALQPKNAWDALDQHALAFGVVNESNKIFGPDPYYKAPSMQDRIFGGPRWEKNWGLGENWGRQTASWVEPRAPMSQQMRDMYSRKMDNYSKMFD